MINLRQGPSKILRHGSNIRWRDIEDELAFLTEGREHCALRHLQEHRPGECVMSIEEITQLEQSAAFARERDEKMKTISKSITEVAQIFKELAVLVIDQGTVLDRCANILCSVQMCRVLGLTTTWSTPLSG